MSYNSLGIDLNLQTSAVPLTATATVRPPRLDVQASVLAPEVVTPPDVAVPTKPAEPGPLVATPPRAWWPYAAGAAGLLLVGGFVWKRRRKVTANRRRRRRRTSR